MRRSYPGAAVPDALTAAVSDVEMDLKGAAFTGWPTGADGPFSVSVNRGKADEEKVLVDHRTGGTLYVSQRGYDGTTALPHGLDATLECVTTAIDADEANGHVNSDQAVHGLSAQDQIVGTKKAQTLENKTLDFSGGAGTNVATGIPRTASPEISQDLSALDQALSAEVSARGAADTAIRTDFAAADTAHVNASDPHPQYMTATEAQIAAYAPVGAISMFAGGVIPTGWLLCDGSEVSTTAYPALNAAIGSAFGAAGAGNFRLPNLGARVPRGVGSGVGLGSTGGANERTLAAEHLPKHTHSVTHDHGAVSTTSNDASPLEGVSGGVASGNPAGSGYRAVTTAPIGSHSHSVDIPSITVTSGDGGTALTATPVETLDPYLGLYFIIRAVA